MLELEIQQTTIQYMGFAFWLIKATNTHSEYVLRNAFPQHNGQSKASQCYFIRTLSLFFDLLSLNSAASDKPHEN